MTEPKPTPEKQNPPAAPDSDTRPSAADETSTRARTGFFNRIRGGLDKPVHPSEAEEIVVDPDELS
jgi:hypothetical protein